MQQAKHFIFLGLLGFVYLLTSLRFFPGQPMKSVVETLTHIFSVAPIILGATMVLASVLQRLVGQRLPWDRVARLYLAVAILLECILGLSHYFTINGAV
ncbi:MAG: hypothetical protein ACOY3Z_09670 [Thermodesulfobacteriota bacterium]